MQFKTYICPMFYSNCCYYTNSFAFLFCGILQEIFMCSVTMHIEHLFLFTFLIEI